jgi:hypothetical protein
MSATKSLEIVPYPDHPRYVAVVDPSEPAEHLYVCPLGTKALAEAFVEGFNLAVAEYTRDQAKQ